MTRGFSLVRSRSCCSLGSDVCSESPSPIHSSQSPFGNFSSHEEHFSNDCKISYSQFLLPSSATLTIIISISFYMLVSLSIVYFNWWLFTSAFEFPIFVSWMQQIFGLCLFIIFGHLGKTFSYFHNFPHIKPNWDVAKRVLPLSLSFVGMVGLANICLKFVQISTYQVARGLTILFTVALSYIILNETQKIKTMVACALMVIGFGIGSLDTSTLSLTGVLAGAFSSAFQALYNVAIKKTLRFTDSDPNLLLYYNLWWSSLLFIPIICIAGEGGVISRLEFNPTERAFYIQWASLFLSGLLATAINLSSYWCVKVTSPLTFNITGFTKSIIQSLGGILFFGDLVSAKSLIGITLSVGGSGWYSFLKVQESNNVNKQSPLAAAYRRVEMQRNQIDLEKALQEELNLVITPKQRSHSSASSHSDTTGVSLPNSEFELVATRSMDIDVKTCASTSTAKALDESNTTSGTPPIYSGSIDNVSSCGVLRRNGTLSPVSPDRRHQGSFVNYKHYPLSGEVSTPSTSSSTTVSNEKLGSPLPVVPTKTNYPQQLSGYLLTSCSNNNPPQAKLLPVGPSTISKNVTHSDSNLSAANWLFDQLANSDDEHKD